MISTSILFQNGWRFGVLRCLLGSCFIAVGSQIYIPFDPVPFTLQTFCVLLLGLCCGSKIGTLSVLLYLTEGIMGIPVFAGYNSGISILLGPAGGYLVGFIFAAYITGAMSEKWSRKSLASVFVIGLVGEIVLLLIGYLRLAHFIGFSDACTFGILPFIFGDFFKLTLCAIIASKK
ncbi:MAG: biotin transporter BioY [Holosporales bacterium]|jgi:biotin transport system substrate-specific component|nr:biotin transporter BioY [Holosporales bacterium]